MSAPLWKGPTMAEPQVPDAAVEAAAVAVHATDRLEWLGEPDWADLSAEDADSYRVYARKILAAAYPHLAAQVLRETADQHERAWLPAGSTVGEYLRHRADELERTVREEADTSTPTPEKG